ncbi:hypothetical protein Patl1_25496 [Pistacia atlantica]|uniref:Uncharacterized protein n=1 Tax=Pistacia atlantica TaxID=434234 RepID=A0ACC1B437_9ROSI|nr:hypothetical protein Patl1_25496 [Pistacia atlantica]
MVKLFSHLYTFLLVLSILLQPLPATTSYNVLRYGVKGNGVTDSIQAFINAWAAARGSTGSTSIYVPNGRYLLGSVAFKGVTGVWINGGALDAKGQALWACKAARIHRLHGALPTPTTLKSPGVLSLNSEMFHIVINGCEKVHIEGFKVMAA